MVFWPWGGDQGRSRYIYAQLSLAHLEVRTASFTYLISVRGSLLATARTNIIRQPYEALQARARKDHTSFSWYFNDYNVAAASIAAVGKEVAIVFLQSNSGEGYITVDGNAGDR
jgi:hypothetical protein